MDVIIAGAGIGGLALANGLVHDGHHVLVLERAAQRRADGAAVTIFSNGAAAADGLGVSLDGLGGTVETLEFSTPDGCVFASADLRELRRRTGFGVATVPRSAILDRLGTVPVSYGSEVVAVDGATVTTAAGEQHTADVVVGADGYRSAVRRATLGDEPATRTGWVSWQGLIKGDEMRGTRARCVVGPLGLCGLMPAGDGLVQWWFDVDTAPPTGTRVLDWLRDRFRGFPAPIPALLDRITEVQEFPHVVHRIPDRWGVGPATLLGDAAHAFPPSQAQGANQALEDAWLLRKALARGGDTVAALRGYERLRARRVRRISRLAASEVTNRPPGAAARAIGRLLAPRHLARLQLATIRRASSVLNQESPA